MKKIILFTIISCLVGFGFNAEAQIKDPKKVAKKKITNRTNRKIDKGIDKSLDKFEKGIGGILGKKNSEEAAPESEDRTTNATNSIPADNVEQAETASETPLLNWAKYDFVPGDKVIFEDNMENEENGEFPSRWDLVRGTTENAEFGGDRIIMFRDGTPIIVPYLKNPDIDYLPEVFTIEFDLYVNNHNSFEVLFWDRKNQSVNSSYKPLYIDYQGMNLSPAGSDLPGKKSIENSWAHIAIAYTNGKMKAYLNETRLINIPHLGFDPMGISLGAYHASDEDCFYIKNFRLAKGGVKYYDRFLQDGKIVSNGIRFDVGKATLRPESMGVINEMVKMLREHPDLKMSIEGHTDNDGDTNFNQTLSEERANTVMKKLISQGIDAGRLSYAGYGESRPVDTNDTPEGKATNRRVEFVKM